MAEPFSKTLITRALQTLATALRPDASIELLIVGGAAAIATDLLPNAVTTADVDILNCLPADAIEDLLAAAQHTARLLDLPPAWLSIDAGLFREDLPPDWHTRKIPLLQTPTLTVFTLGRLDFIAMKFAAHRTKDLEHLQALQPTTAECAFVRQHLESRLAETPTTDTHTLGKLQKSLFLLNHWPA